MDTTSSPSAPTSPGRPDGGLYRLKAGTAGRLDSAIRAAIARGITADQLTWAGMAAAALAAATVVAGARWAPGWWLILGPLVLTRLALAIADGEVARRCGTEGPTGAVLGEVTDRGGDVLLAAALAAIAPLPAVLAAVGVMVGDDVAAIGWAVTGRRAFAGVGGKPDRNVAVALGLGAAVVWPVLATATVWLLAAMAWTGAVLRLRAVWASARAAS